MSLPVPRLDNTNFEQLVEEARARIPRYAPEWTDHNLHDPGITLLELFAWIVDQQIYQVGFVGDRHLAAFAALLGVRPRAAAPARGLLWPHTDADVSSGELKRGSPVACVEQPGLSFELEADIHLTPARIEEATITAAGETVSLSSVLGVSGSSFRPRTSAPASGATLEFRLDRPLVETRDPSATYPVALGIEVAPPPSARSETATPWGPLVFEYRTGQSGFWQRLELAHDGTIALARTGIVFLRVPTIPGGGQACLRLRLDRGLLPIAPRIVRFAFNVLPVVQLETRPEEVLGESNGLPDQRFPLELTGLPGESDESEVILSDTPIPAAPPRTAPEGKVIATGYRRLRIEVEEAGGFQQWRPTDDLTTCGPQNRVYEVDVAAGQIRFGNGVNGRIPRHNAQVRHRDYHLTAGASGSLRSGLTWRIKGVSTTNEVYGSNPQPLTGGEDAWDAQRLQQQARETVLRRKVLLQDSEVLAAATGLSGYGVARAAVLSRFHPAFPEAEIPGARTLVVVPWRDPGDGKGAAVDNAYPVAVAAALRPHRVLGERLTVIAAKPVPVRVRAELLVEAGVDAKKLEAEAAALLNARLSDIAVGDQVEPWPIGRPVTIGEIKTLLAGIGRVIAVPCCELARGEGAFATESIALQRFEVAIGDRHEIVVRHLATE